MAKSEKPDPYTHRQWEAMRTDSHGPTTHSVWEGKEDRVDATVDHLFARVAELEKANAGLADLAELYLEAMCSDRCDSGDDCEEERAEIRKLRG